MSDTDRPAATAEAPRPSVDAPAFRIEGLSYLKIAAIEGLSPTGAADRRAIEFDRLDLSPEERRRAIVEAHRPKR